MDIRIEIDDEDFYVELNFNEIDVVKESSDLILVGEKKGFVYTQIEKQEKDEVEFLGTAKIPQLYRYLKISRLVTDPWSK